MALAKGTINPLNVLGLRRLNYVPEHFARMSIKNHLDEINSWVYSNLNGRYAINRTLKAGDDNKMIETQEIGFEDPTELTMFSLACPYLHKP
jgi:hypothetical protein